MTAARRKCIKVALERVTRTDLICVACGRFRTEWAIVPGAYGGGEGAPPTRNESGEATEVVAGVHTGCIDQLAVRHTRKREKVAVQNVVSGVDPEDVRT